MTSIGLTRLCAGRVHYAWIVLAVMFSATLAGVGVRAAPGVMILPLQRLRLPELVPPDQIAGVGCGQH